jgi:hypothetical protein
MMIERDNENNDESFIEVGWVYLRNEVNEKNKEEWDYKWDGEETEDNEKVMMNYIISVD